MRMSQILLVLFCIMCYKHQSTNKIYIKKDILKKT